MKLTLMNKITLINMNFYGIISIICPKCLVISFLIISFSLDLWQSDIKGLETYLLYTLPVYNMCSKIKSDMRIGPHNRDIISVIFGSLLGEGTAERKPGSGTQFTFFQEAIHVKYLLWLHNQLQTWGYCKSTVPTITKKLGKKGKIRKNIRFHTWTYTSFDWIYDIWYVNGVKIIPQCISDYLTPLALAIWIMDSGVKDSGGLNFTNCFSFSDCLLLVQVLDKNFGVKATIQSTGCSKKNRVCILKDSMPKLKEIVGPFIRPEMKYKLLP